MSRMLKYGGGRKKRGFTLQMENSELYQRRLEQSSSSNDSLEDALTFDGKNNEDTPSFLEIDDYFSKRPLPPVPTENVGAELQEMEERNCFLPSFENERATFSIPFGTTNLPVASPRIQVTRQNVMEGMVHERHPQGTATSKPSPEHFPGRPLPPIPVQVVDDGIEPFHSHNRNVGTWEIHSDTMDPEKRIIVDIPFGTTNLPIDSPLVTENNETTLQNEASESKYPLRSPSINNSQAIPNTQGGSSQVQADVGSYDLLPLPDGYMHEPLARTLSDDPNLRKKVDEDSLSASYRHSLLARYDSKLPLPDFVPPPPPRRHPDTKLTRHTVDIDSCYHCKEIFAPEEKMITAQGHLWHTRCFVCVQCFRPFPDNIFYVVDDRRYCEHDYLTLFASTCKKCETVINDRVIRTRFGTWHSQCFTCDECKKELADIQWRVIGGTILCKTCYDIKNAGKKGLVVCDQCSTVINEKALKFKGNQYHPWHFNCTNCGVQLTDTARALTISYTDDGSEILTQGDYILDERATLYCLPCHDRLGIPICGACRRPIEGRVVDALGKSWHIEHFVCVKCERPFLGKRHYEMRGLPYCEKHYHQHFGVLCFVCNSVITRESVSVMKKSWCVNHFSCFFCNRFLSPRSSLYEVDLRPSCKRCFKMLPKDLRLRLNKYVDLARV